MSDKADLKTVFLESIDQEIDSALVAAQRAQETASHEDNKPENQYDTLSLEAAYLAHGQSERIFKLQQERMLLAKWIVPDFTDNDPISTGALIVLECEHVATPKVIWITPKGGRTLIVNNQTILVISPDTPLAKQLDGLLKGDELRLGQWPSQQVWEIIEVD